MSIDTRAPEVIVVGAGPAGAATAYHLAERGRRVLLLDRRRFPRDKSCGDGLTITAVRELAAMGVVAQLSDAHPVRGVRVSMRGKGVRDFDYPATTSGPGHGLVLPRLLLDERICRRAVAAGAVLWEDTAVTGPIMAGGAVIGVRVTRHGVAEGIHAPVVVAADGATSALGRAAGLVLPGSEGLGFALRSYWDDVDWLTDRLEIFMPLLDSTDRHLLPSYGWVFPTGPRAANVGVGVFSRDPRVNHGDLFRQFLRELGQRDARFRTARQVAGWKGAPLRFDFSPDRCSAPGILLVGDAAGMVSPFTGEGISYALESGKLAAEVIDRNLPSGSRTTPDLSDYAILLERSYGGYFETGRKVAGRYLLVWRVLESTFDSERAPFTLCRRAVLFPEGVGEPYASNILDDVGPLLARGLDVRTDLLAVGEVLTTTVRRDWPVLARLSAASYGDPGVPFRPALLLLLASALGRKDDPRRIPVGAAVELGYLAALAQTGVEEEPTNEPASRDGKPANWGNMFAILVGDFLLSKACQLATRAGEDLLTTICIAVERACTGQLREVERAFDVEVTEAQHLEVVAGKTATLFELPCRLGGRLGGLADGVVEALAAYGHHLGMAFQLADDALDLAGHPSRVGKDTANDLREGTYSLAVIRTLADPEQGPRLRPLLTTANPTRDDLAAAVDLVRAGGGIEYALATAREYATRARAALDALPPGPVHLTLDRLTDYVTTRNIPHATDLTSAFDDDVA